MTYKRNGYRHSEATRKKISESNRRGQHAGVKMSAETKAKISAAHKGRPYVPAKCPHCDFSAKPGPLVTHIKVKHQGFKHPGNNKKGNK